MNVPCETEILIEKTMLVRNIQKNSRQQGSCWSESSLLSFSALWTDEIWYHRLKRNKKGFTKSFPLTQKENILTLLVKIYSKTNNKIHLGFVFEFCLYLKRTSVSPFPMYSSSHNRLPVQFCQGNYKSSTGCWRCFCSTWTCVVALGPTGIWVCAVL